MKNEDIKKENNKSRSVNSYSDEQPTYKGEVYFSNPPKAVNIQPVKSNTDIHRKMNGRVNVNIITFLSIVIISTVILSSIAISCINDILAINRSSEIVTINIPENANTKEVIKILNENGLVKQRVFCNIFTDLTEKMKKSKKPEYLNGVYYIKSNIGLEAMLNECKSVQVSAETIKLVFPEGWSIYQMIKKIDEYNVCKSDYLYAALAETKFDYPFVSAIKVNDKRTQSLEGYFFPDTYEFFINENANSALRRLVSNFDEKWTDDYTQRTQELGISIDDVITIASIIQKEAANEDQMTLISSVIHNRLAKSSEFPALDCNSTKDYITNFVKPVLGEANANTYMDAYNTYITVGLPPGPICNPGLKAIEAALYPQDTNYYYFQHDDSGKIYMAKTLDEQNKNTMEVLRANNK